MSVTLNWFRTQDLGPLPILTWAVPLLIGAMKFITLGLVADMLERFKRKQY